MDNKKNILELINENESEYLDFKSQYYDENDKASLIHDVLCLANSRYDGDRYIIFGINDEKKTVGIEREIKQNDIVQILRDAHLNRSLYNDILLTGIEHNSKKIMYLQIRDRPDKPFFLLKDYNKGKKCVRAGVIYTRNADGNTAIDKTATDDEIELMWRQRFGLDQPPLNRLSKYLEDLDNWKRIDPAGLEEEYFYQPFPEFRVIAGSSEHISANVPNNDKWLPPRWTIGEQKIIKIKYKLVYFGFDLESCSIWWGVKCARLSRPKID